MANRAKNTQSSISFIGSRALESGDTVTLKPSGFLSPSVASTIVKAAVKDELSEMNVSSDFYDALDEEVGELLSNAERRASENDRKTVQPRDL